MAKESDGNINSIHKMLSRQFEKSYESQPDPFGQELLQKKNWWMKEQLFNHLTNLTNVNDKSFNDFLILKNGIIINAFFNKENNYKNIEIQTRNKSIPFGHLFSYSYFQKKSTYAGNHKAADRMAKKLDFTFSPDKFILFYSINNQRKKSYELISKNWINRIANYFVLKFSTVDYGVDHFRIHQFDKVYFYIIANQDMIIWFLEHLPVDDILDDYLLDKLNA